MILYIEQVKMHDNFTIEQKKIMTSNEIYIREESEYNMLDDSIHMKLKGKKKYHFQ